MLAIKLITAKIKNTKSRVFPISRDKPPTLFAPNKIDTKPRIKNAIAALNIITLLVESKISVRLMAFIVPNYSSPKIVGYMTDSNCMGQYTAFYIKNVSFKKCSPTDNRFHPLFN